MERGVWSGKLDFLMSLVAYTVGLDNLLRLPYLCYKNNGGAFLVPYILCFLVMAMPIFLIEVCMGQFSGEGGITMWKVCPLFKGVGIASNIIASLSSIYYCIIICWTLFYVFSSLTYSTLPWLTCDNVWNSGLCSVGGHNASRTTAIGQENFTTVQTAVSEFWEKRVLQLSSGIDEFGSMQWELTTLLVIVWVITYFVVYKGITNSRKSIYVCAIAPSLLLAVLLTRSLTLDGAYSGLIYFFKSEMKTLLSIEAWKDAGTHVVYSSGIGFGTLMALGSYNKYQLNVYRDAIALCIIKFVTGLASCCLVFSVLGFMANATGNAVEQVVKDGLDLAFLVFPQAVSMLPTPQVWSVMLFLMIALLVFGSVICLVEGVILALSDQFPNVLRKNRKIFAAFMCLAGFLLGLPMVSRSGQYWLALVDTYGAGGLALLFVLFFELVGLSYGFGAARIYNVLENMLGEKFGRYWYYCWRYTAPLFCMTMFGITLFEFQPVMTTYVYPPWAIVLGLTMSFMPMLTIPAYAVYRLIQTPGKTIFEKIKQSMQPNIELRPVNHRHQHQDQQNTQCRYGGENRKWRFNNLDVNQS